MRWIRLDVAFDDSPWIFLLGAEAQLSWIKLLCHVKAQGIGGRCKALDYRVAAKKFGVSADAVQSLIESGIQEGAIAVEDDVWVITAWAKYQENDATSRERKQKQRAKGQSEPKPEEVTEVTDGHGVTDDVTVCHGVTPVTDGVTCRVTETETVTSIPVGEVSKTSKAAVLEPDPFSAEPFHRAARVLKQVADHATGFDPPRRADALRQIRADSPVQGLLAMAEGRGMAGADAEDWVARLYLLAIETWNQPPTWPSVFAQRNQLAGKMAQAPPKERKPFSIPLSEFGEVSV